MSLPSPCCRRLPLLLFFSLAQFSVDADTHYVSETGSDVPPYTSWETASTSIQAAIDAASEGDTALVAPGVYCENLLMQKSLILKGAGADLTVIGGRPGKDGYCRSDGNPRLACVNISDVWIESLSVAGGWARENGGGILIRDSANVVIRECAITGNRVDLGSGGGVYVEDSKQVSLLNCAVTDNRIDSYEGASGGGIFAVGSEVSIRSCLIRRNSAREGGGGVFLGCSGQACSIVRRAIGRDG